MTSKPAAILGIVSFSLVLAVCLAVVFHGAARPGPATSILLGDHLPEFRLPNSSGRLVNANELSDGMLLIVYASPAELSPTQRAEIRQIADTLRQTTYLEVVAVTDRMTNATDPAQVLPEARELLIDQSQVLRVLLGRADDPVVCLLDRGHKLCFRTTIPDGPVNFARTSRDLEEMRRSVKAYAMADFSEQQQ